jgi:hypothetical protein
LTIVLKEVLDVIKMKNWILGAVCIILVVCLIGVFAYYWMQVNTLNDEKNTLTATHQTYVSTHGHINSEYDNLDNYKGQLETWLAGNLTELNETIKQLRTPKLVKVNFGASDEKPWLSADYLRIYGVVLNVGSDAARNCKLHVVLYQSGGVVAKDTYIDLGTINGEGWTNVNTNVYYEGSALTSWTITPQWTT